MFLEQLIPRLYGKRHGYVDRVDIRSFELGLRALEPLSWWLRPTLHGMDHVPQAGGALLARIGHARPPTGLGRRRNTV